MKKRSWFKSKGELIVFLISFLITLAFFLWQRHFFSWDFSVYMMNAEHVLGLGNYFEWMRPPFASFLLMLFRPLGRAFANYAFVIFVAALYFFSLKLFHDKFLRKIEQSEIFYLFAINPFVLIYGIYAGTELLSLSLIMLFFVFAFSTCSFLLLGLSMLTRYSNIFLLPLVLISKNIKKIAVGICIIVLMFLLWFLINYIFAGNALTSVMDYYALNVIGREGSVFKSTIGKDLLMVANIMLPFFVLGILFIFVKKKTAGNKTAKKKTAGKMIMINWMVLVFLALTLATYFWSSMKLERFLFNLALPFSYFSVFGFSFLASLFKNKERRRIFFVVMVAVLILFSTLAFFLRTYTGETELREVKSVIDRLAVEGDECVVSSNRWIYFNYYNKLAYYPARSLLRADSNKIDFYAKIDEGYNIIIFKNHGSEENYIELKPLIDSLDSELVFEDNEKYVWVRDRDKCKEPFIVNDTYIERMSKLEGWEWLKR